MVTAGAHATKDAGMLGYWHLLGTPSQLSSAAARARRGYPGTLLRLYAGRRLGHGRLPALQCAAAAMLAVALAVQPSSLPAFVLASPPPTVPSC